MQLQLQTVSARGVGTNLSPNSSLSAPLCHEIVALTTVASAAACGFWDMAALAFTNVRLQFKNVKNVCPASPAGQVLGANTFAIIQHHRHCSLIRAIVTLIVFGCEFGKVAVIDISVAPLGASL